MNHRAWSLRQTFRGLRECYEHSPQTVYQNGGASALGGFVITVTIQSGATSPPVTSKNRIATCAMATICRAWITVKGKRIYARDKGLRAFCWDDGKDEESDLKDEQNKKNRPTRTVLPPKRRKKA